MSLGASWLWQPSVTKTVDRPGGSWVDRARTWAEPVYVIPIYVLGAIGLALVPRAFATLVLALAAYNTLLAALFVGETRYRVPWDFLLVVLAGAAVAQLAPRLARQLRQRTSPAAA